MTNHPRTSDEIREAYISFFREKGHQLLPPWPLVPIGDPTSMFTLTVPVLATRSITIVPEAELNLPRHVDRPPMWSASKLG
jgi:hypothetical protein